VPDLQLEEYQSARDEEATCRDRDSAALLGMLHLRKILREPGLKFQLWNEGGEV